MYNSSKRLHISSPSSPLKVSNFISILSLPKSQRSKVLFMPFLQFFHSQTSIFPNNIQLSNEIWLKVLQNLKLTTSLPDETLNFNTNGILFLFSGCYSIGNTVYEVKMAPILGKIGNNGFECPIRTTLLPHSPLKTSIQAKTLEKSYYCFIAMSELLSIARPIIKKKKEQDRLMLANSPIFKTIPKKTLDFLVKRIFIERSFNLGTILPQTGLFFVKSGDLELLRHSILKNTAPFSLASLSKGETYGFYNENREENLILRSLSRQTKVLWVCKEGMRELESFDIVSYTRLKKSLLESSKRRKERGQEICRRLSEWDLNKEDFEAKMKGDNREKGEVFIETARLKRMDSLRTIPSLKEIPEPTKKECFNCNRRMKSLGEIQISRGANKPERKSFLMGNLKKQLLMYPLSISNPTPANLKRLAVRILVQKQKKL